jgi:hypothetical protein
MACLILTFVTLFLLSVTQTVASPCIAFDANWNLYAFGLEGKDYNASTQDKWTGSNTANDVTTSGRPPFDGSSPACYLSQYSNAIYVMGADTANPASVYIYDTTASSWSQQPVTTGGFDPTSFNAILDHDTNVFYALSHGEMYFLDMKALKASSGSAISWTDVGATPYGTSYQPVMALADNHIYFLDVPNVPAGSADIFVIHFSYFQPTSQAYPLSSGNMPATHGKATSFFQPSLVQQEFAFIPDDGSATYVVNVLTNSTQQLAGPSTKDSNASYFASITSLVQLSSSGVVSYLPYTQGNTAANSAAAWSTISAISSVAPATTSATGTSSSSGISASSAANSTSTSSRGGGSSVNEASSVRKISRALSAALALGAVACLL